jgi:hypothetical protein
MLVKFVSDGVEPRATVAIELESRHKRCLFDKVVIATQRACDLGDAEAAWFLLDVLEMVVARSRPHTDRNSCADTAPQKHCGTAVELYPYGEGSNGNLGHVRQDGRKLQEPHQGVAR